MRVSMVYNLPLMAALSLHILKNRLQLILLDRDGVINQESADFIRSPAEWQPLPGAMQAIANLQARYQLAVVTNQSGVGRGYLSLATLDAIHAKMNQTLIASGGQALDVFFCPHLPDAGCDCRKPAPGLIHAAMQKNAADPQQTLVVGDAERDMVAADRAGAYGAQVLSGKTEQALPGRPYVAESLASLAALLCEQ
ncbi:MAG: HAD-IIIA family hydrolase [Pseudomonadota bacterium]